MAVQFQTARLAAASSSATSYMRAAAEEDATLAPAPKQKAAPPRIGFGENSVSSSSAAVKMITTNLREARKLVPTLQDIREVSAARRAAIHAQQLEARAQVEEAARKAAEHVERRIPEANPQARNFETLQAAPTAPPNQTEAADQSDFRTPAPSTPPSAGGPPQSTQPLDLLA